MKIVLKLLVLILITGMFFFGSKKGDPAKELVLLYIKFDNVVGDQDLLLNDKEYSNASGEKFTISQLQYFISNMKLYRTDGKEYVIKQDDSYFLVQEHDTATQIIQLKVPAGDYKQISFVVGVDSLRNTMHISKRTGVLDPASSMDQGMYWTWNSGYIFFKLEGTSPAALADPTGNRKFRYHIGGFGGYKAKTFNNIRTISLDLSQNEIAKPRKNKNATIRIKADILKAFEGSERISIAAHPSVMFSEYSVKVANNYSKMFSHHRTQN